MLVRIKLTQSYYHRLHKLYPTTSIICPYPGSCPAFVGKGTGHNNELKYYILHKSND